MQVKFEFVTYDANEDTFEIDENIYSYELNDEQAQTYELLKSVDVHLYNWFQESKLFNTWIKEEVYPDQIGKKIAICDIDDVSFRRYYFFKVTSADSHYEYFKKLFDILHEEDWQDREEVGKIILENLKAKRQELFIELAEDVIDSEGPLESDENNAEVIDQ